MKYLTDCFKHVVSTGKGRPWLFPMLRADLAARSAWYYGNVGRGLSLRMLFADGGCCTVLYRLMRTLKRWHLGPLAAIVYKLNAFLTGAVIGRGAEFGPGLVILHSVGLVINTAVRGGENVIVEGCVTIGAEKGRSPTLGDHVFIGSGARVLGGIRAGSGARIGANAVVLADVPDGATAVGIPAKVIKTAEGN